jgi:glycosyltransferase involved in cell wall biosynthesis
MAPMFRCLGRVVDAFVVIDDLARPVLARMVGRARVEMIPPPLDEERFAVPPRSSEGTPVLVHAGRITREKGVLDLLEACRLLDERGVHAWELRLVGPLERSTSGELEEIERVAEALGRVTFVGWVDDIAPELAKADVFVSASHREGLSGSIAEAAMSGLPVVASDVGAVNTIVRDGVDGYVVAAHDPRAFADALQRLVEDPARRLAMGASASAHSTELYGRERIAARYGALIEELV